MMKKFLFQRGSLWNEISRIFFYRIFFFYKFLAQKTSNSSLVTILDIVNKWVYVYPYVLMERFF